MITRNLEKYIKNWLFKGKILIIYGPRQAGKTTLAKKILLDFVGTSQYFNCEVESVKNEITSMEPKRIKSFFGNNTIIVLDEAQSIENIGKALKVFHDEYPEIQIIATGSSSFDLANKINEPLTGRSIEFMLPPVSIYEYVETFGKAEYLANADLLMRYGMYPEILNRKESSYEMQSVLENIKSNYLYKDILSYEDVRKPKMIEDLLKILAYAIGSEISLNGLSRDLGIAVQTIDRYITLLEKMFVLKRIYAFSNNKPNEIKKGFKIYFFDIGIRNLFVLNLEPINTRLDAGQIFENMFFIERYKNNQLKSVLFKQYFWRTYSQKEIDFIEEDINIKRAFECKFKKDAIKKTTLQEFKSSYPEIPVEVVNMDNYLEYLL